MTKLQKRLMIKPNVLKLLSFVSAFLDNNKILNQLLVSFMANSSSVNTESGLGASELKFFCVCETAAAGVRHCFKICNRNPINITI